MKPVTRHTKLGTLLILTQTLTLYSSDEAQTKIIVLREKAEKEQQAYIQEIKELDRILEQDRRLKEFMATKNSNRLKSDGTSNLKKGFDIIICKSDLTKQL